MIILINNTIDGSREAAVDEAYDQRPHFLSNSSFVAMSFTQYFSCNGVLVHYYA